jgi:predicted DNA-binding transcriptional regulator YafY
MHFGAFGANFTDAEGAVCARFSTWICASRGMFHGMDVLLRHACLLSLLPRAPQRIGVAALQRALAALGFEVDLTTLRKDLKRLSRGFPIVCDESRPSGWSWAHDAPKFEAGGYEPALSLAVSLACASFGGALPASVRTALRRHASRAQAALDAQGPGGLGELVRRFRQLPGDGNTDAPPVDEDVLEAVGGAVATGRRLSVRRRGERRPKILDALGVLRRGATLQVVGRAGRGAEIQVVALHRLESARLLDAPADRADFDLDAWLAGVPRLALVARVTAAAAERLEDAPLSSDQTLEPLPRGDLRLRATAVDDDALRSRLLGQGAALVVEAPDALVGELAATARALAAAYAGATPVAGSAAPSPARPAVAEKLGALVEPV